MWLTPQWHMLNTLHTWICNECNVCHCGVSHHQSVLSNVILKHFILLQPFNFYCFPFATSNCSHLQFCQPQTLCMLQIFVLYGIVLYNSDMIQHITGHFPAQSLDCCNALVLHVSCVHIVWQTFWLRRVESALHWRHGLSREVHLLRLTVVMLRDSPPHTEQSTSTHDNTWRACDGEVFTDFDGNGSVREVRINSEYVYILTAK